MCLGEHPIKTWATTQSVIALSTGEAEFYGIVKGSSQGLGAQALLKDLGIDARVRVLTDASTGKSLASRRGLGKVRHIDVSELWVQEVVANGRVDIIKVKGTFNSADICTKYLNQAEIAAVMEQIAATFLDGRSESAPALAK